MEIGKCGWTEREIKNPESEYPNPNKFRNPKSNLQQCKGKK
jgi:hypothetical protein